jgi:hypothetical protein
MLKKKYSISLNKWPPIPQFAMVQLNDFLTLQWLESGMHLVETVPQVLNFDLSSH